jgi:predicted nucleic acid-binding Zn ribbon protein
MTGPYRPRNRLVRGNRKGVRKSSTPTWSPPWRKGLPARPDEDPVAPGTGTPQPIGTVLEGLFGAAGPWQAGLAAGILSRAWADVVGGPLAAESAPAGLDSAGTLSIKVSSPAWATQLRFLCDAVVANANEALGRPAVARVRVFVDPRLEDARRGRRPPGSDSDAAPDAAWDAVAGAAPDGEGTGSQTGRGRAP